MILKKVGRFRAIIGMRSLRLTWQEPQCVGLQLPGFKSNPVFQPQPDRQQNKVLCIHISIVNQKLFQFSLLGWARGHQSSIDMPGSPSFVPSNSHVSLASSFWWSPHDRCGKDDPGPCHCHDNVGMEDPCWRSLSLDHWLVDVSNGERKKTTICIDIYLFLYGKLSGALRKERNLTFITYPEQRNG